MTLDEKILNGDLSHVDYFTLPDGAKVEPREGGATFGKWWRVIGGGLYSENTMLDIYRHGALTPVYKREPRTWGGEYAAERIGPVVGRVAFSTIPEGVEKFRVKWTATEILDEVEGAC